MAEMFQLVLFKLKLVFADKVFLGAMLIIPLVFTLLIGSAQNYQQQNPNIPVAVVDNDQSDYSRLIVERLTHKRGIRVLQVDEPKAVELVENYQVEVAFVIKQGLKEAILNEHIDEGIILYKSPNSLSYGIIQEMLASEVIRIAANSSAANWVVQVYGQYGLKQQNKTSELWDKAWGYADSLWEPEPLLKLEYQELKGRVAAKTASQHIPVITSTSISMLIMFVMLLMLFNCSWLIEERNNSTLKRLMLVPGLLGRVYIANIVALFLVATTQVIIFELLIQLVYKLNILSSYLQVLVLAAYILAVTGLGMFFSSIFNTQAQLQSGAPMLALFTSILGGCFWSFMQPPGLASSLAFITPQGWALTSLQAIMTNDYSITDIFTSITVLVVFGGLLLVISYHRIRKLVS
jgi:ABC-type multidrug transport system permease subunit